MTTKLKDIQNSADLRGIDIQKVGVKDVEIPLIIQRKNESNQTVYAKARMSVSLPKHYKGTHMSRFMEVLNEWREKNLLGVDIEGCLKDIMNRLDANSAELEFSFKYFLNKTAPISKNICTMSYDCSFEGEIDKNGKYTFILGAKVPVTTLCPCSKEISDFGAHNQRAIIKIKVSYDNGKMIWLEDLISLAEQCCSAQVYPLLKREDEKFVTEQAYQNPKFVEDVLRDVVTRLRNHPDVNWFKVECEAFESIHNHSAWAFQQEGVL